ncbi:hypothetical protein Tco_1455184 [Tanacetum coccineum]
MVLAQVDDDEDDVDGIFPWKVMVLGYGLERMIPIRQKKRKHVNAKKRNQRSNGTYVLSSRLSLYRNNFAV